MSNIHEPLAYVQELKVPMKEPQEWEMIFDTLSELTLVTDPERRVVRCNQAVIMRLGVQRQHVVGLDINSIFFSNEIPECDPFAPGVREVNVPRISGDFLVTNNPLCSSAIFHGMVHVMMDITERKKAEEMVGERESLYRTLAENSYAGVYVVQNGKFCFFNGKAASYTGYTKGELVGQSTELLVHPDDLTGEKKNARDMLKGERSIPYEFRFVTKDGEVRWIMETVASIMYEGKPAILGNCMDITEKRKREMHDLHAQKLESVGQLAAGIAHEINTPIQFIGDNIHFMNESFREINSLMSLCHDIKHLDTTNSTACNFLRNRFLERMDAIDMDYLLTEIPQAIEQSLNGIKRVSHIVQAMREFSHPGGTGTEKTNFDINKAIESTVLLTRNEWKYTSELTTSLDPDLPFVKGYPADFNQVILNLIVNAVHAVHAKLEGNSGEKGHIYVITQRIDDGVEVLIRDTGSGIPPEVQSRIFDPFFTTKEVGKGTGQGLTIARDIIVHKHGGRIYFKSEVGKGTTFHILLPVEEL